MSEFFSIRVEFKFGLPNLRDVALNLGFAIEWLHDFEIRLISYGHILAR
jgi:hypothetical protein